jgi:hypothetical protein
MIIRKTLSDVLVVSIVLTAVGVGGRVRADQATSAVQPSGGLLFSIRTLEAMTGPIKRDLGYFFYIVDVTKMGDQTSSFLIPGYQMRDGKVVDRFGGGTADSEEFLTEIEAVHFEAFDFDAELKRVENSHGPQAIVVDGAKYEIRFVHRGIDFKLVAVNPVPSIEGAAKYSPAIAKLKALLDVFALHYGRLKMF